MDQELPKSKETEKESKPSKSDEFHKEDLYQEMNLKIFKRNYNLLLHHFCKDKSDKKRAKKTDH